MLAVVLLWAVNNVGMKVGIAVVPPLAFVFARFAVVIAVVWVWIGWRRMPVRIAPRDFPLFALVGFTGFGAYNVLIAIGFERTSAFSAALLISLGPVCTMILARLIGLERPTLWQWLATALALLGVLVFVGDKLHGEGLGVAASGDLIIIAAAPLFGIYGLAVRPLTARYGATVTTAWAVTVGLATIAPWSLPAAADVAWGDLAPPIWGSVVYAAVASMLIGYTLMAWAITRSGVARTAPYLLLVPVGTGIISALLLGESFGPLKIVGAAMVLTGIALVRLLGRPVVAGRALAPPATPRVVVARGEG
jgi:O-acetylserine/cysteine efflux transporter